MPQTLRTEGLFLGEKNVFLIEEIEEKRFVNGQKRFLLFQVPPACGLTEELLSYTMTQISKEGSPILLQGQGGGQQGQQGRMTRFSDFSHQI